VVEQHPDVHPGTVVVVAVDHEMEEAALPPDYQRIHATVRQATRPVMARQVGEVVGVDVSVRAKLEPLRGRLVRLTDRDWLRKLPDGRPPEGGPPSAQAVRRLRKALQDQR
jgi:hypothetical protein